MNLLSILFCIILLIISYTKFYSTLENKNLDINYVIEQSYFNSLNSLNKKIYNNSPSMVKELLLKKYKNKNPNIIKKLEIEVATNVAKMAAKSISELNSNLSNDDKANLAAVAVLSKPITVAILDSSKVIATSPEVASSNSNSLIVNVAKTKMDLIDQLMVELNNRLNNKFIDKNTYSKYLNIEIKKINDAVDNSTKSQLSLASASMAANKVAPLLNNVSSLSTRDAVQSILPGIKISAQIAAENAARQAAQKLESTSTTATDDILQGILSGIKMAAQVAAENAARQAIESFTNISSSDINNLLISVKLPNEDLDMIVSDSFKKIFNK